MTELVAARVATHDPPPKGIPNPIHDDDGAQGAGYQGSLVAGVRTYGWAAETVLEAVGPHWLSHGWVDFTLRRPLFVGDRLITSVALADDHWSITCTATRDGDTAPHVVLDGTCGLGDAAWLDVLDPPAPSDGVDPPTRRPTYDLDTIPLREPLHPLAVEVSASAATRLATDDLGLRDRRYAGERPLIHPYFVAGRMAPLTRHNFTYGPTIHVRSQIQHVDRLHAPGVVTVGASIVDAYERKGHLYQVLDGVVSGPSGPAALIRHHTIFQPRGTTMPEPAGGEAGHAET